MVDGALMNSIEKVTGLKDWLLSQAPEDEEAAQRLQLAASFAPLLVKAIPDDPVELDRYLRMVAWAAKNCRSDDAAELGVFELVDGEWQAVEMVAGAGP